MSVSIKVTGGLNIEWGQIDPKATGGLKEQYKCLNCRNSRALPWFAPFPTPALATDGFLSLQLLNITSHVTLRKSTRLFDAAGTCSTSLTRHVMLETNVVIAHTSLNNHRPGWIQKPPVWIFHWFYGWAQRVKCLVFWHIDRQPTDKWKNTRVGTRASMHPWETALCK